MRSSRFGLALFAGFTAACGAFVTPGDRDAAPSDVRDAMVAADACGARAPIEHRAVSSACPTVRLASSCTTFPGSCSTDAECTMGVNGRCSNTRREGCACTYDRCTTDSDCATGGPCACRQGVMIYPGANTCLAGNCRTDSDCGGCGYCSPSFGSCGDYAGVVAYYCHTPTDECTDDADCRASGTVGAYCAYEPTVGRWRCSNSHCDG